MMADDEKSRKNSALKKTISEYIFQIVKIKDLTPLLDIVRVK